MLFTASRDSTAILGEYTRRIGRHCMSLSLSHFSLSIYLSSSLPPPRQASEMKASAVESGSTGTAESANVTPPTASQSSTTGAAAGKMAANRKAK